MKETWKVTPVNDNYAVSNVGRVKRITSYRSTKRNKILTPNVPANGYWRVTLSKNAHKITHKVHFLVARTFIGIRPDGYQINHKDGNKNNNNVTNLEYCTAIENCRHASRLGLHARGESNGAIRLLKKRDVFKIRKLVKKGAIQREAGMIFGISQSSVYDIIHGRSWAWL